MSEAQTAAGIAVRAYRDEDEPAVLELLNETLGGGPGGRRSPDFFRWKHFANPFGRSFMLMAESEGDVIGLRAFMRWRFECGGRIVSAVRAVDTATHPAYQGRGIFSMLTRRAIDDLKGDTELIFNTPNSQSLPGYLKMGWRSAGKLPIRVCVKRPVRLLTRARSRTAASAAETSLPVIAAAPASEILADGPGVEALLLDAQVDDDRFRTPKDLAFLRWRYGAAPLLGYRAIAAGPIGALKGLVIFRVRPRGSLWETTVAELIVRRGDRSTARALLKAAVRAARVDHATCHFARGSTPARSVRRWLPAPGGVTFVVNPLRRVSPAPTELGSWALSLGDVEVF